MLRAASAAASDDPALTPDALVPDGAAYTAAVGAYMAAGLGAEAERLVREMARAGVSAGPRLYNTLIAAHGRSGDLEGVKAAEQQMRAANVRPNAATHGARVAAYVRCGEMELALRALRSGQP
jgi:leucine-rich PPR motif-containing protein